MRFARSREKNKFCFRFFSLFFASNFSLSTKAKLIVLFLLCFAYKNFSFRFRSFRFASKRNEINVFSLLFTILGIDIKSKRPGFIFFFDSLQIVPEFHSILFRFEVFASFSFCFRFISFFCIEAKKICFHFASKQKWWQFFASVLLHFASKRKRWQFFASFSLHFASKQKWWQFFDFFCFAFA